MLSHDRLRGHDHEGVLDEPSHIVAGLVLRPLERIGAQIEQHGQAKLNHRLLPDTETLRLLLQEHRLPLIIAKAGKVAVVGPVEEFAALVRALAREKVALVIAVEMHLEVLARRVIALQQLVLDGGLAGRGDQCRCPILRGEDVVDLGMRGGTSPGQRTIAGTRYPPSQLVFFSPLKGVVPPSGQVNVSAPLSVV